MPSTLYLIDAYAQIFRAYYAIRGGMRSPVTGEPTHAIFGFTGMLLKLFQQYRPDYLAVALDVPGRTFRDDILETYKATRNATPDDLTSQIPRILELIDLFGIPAIGHPGLEADDVMGCLTLRALEEDPDVLVRLVSKDKDLEQLIGPRVALFDIHTDTLIDADALYAAKGIRPEQVVDVLALMGDSVDNVPGVEGIGPKTAAQLVHEFGSLEGILANLDRIPGKRRENLAKAAAHLPLSKQLVTLKCDVELPYRLADLRQRPPNVPGLIALFQQLGFNRYQNEVRRMASAEPADGEAGPAIPHRAPESVSYRAITTHAELDSLIETMRRAPLMAVDTETTSLRRDAALCGLSFAWEEGQAAYVPTRSPEPAAHLQTEEALACLKQVLEDESVPKCGHNLKYDAQVLLRHGVLLRGVVFDSMLANALVDPSGGSQKLDVLAETLLGHRMIPITSLIGTGVDQLSMDACPLAQVTDYAAEDADIALRLVRALQPKLDEMGISRLLREVEAPLSVVLAEMEHHGILCDPEELDRQGAVLRARVEELRQEIFRLAGVEFNLDSTRQLAEVLFDRLGLAEGKRTRTGRSTDIEVLEKLASQEDRNEPRTAVPRLVIEYRQLAKLISTYVGNLKAAIDPRTRRIHSTFHQLVTATGRLASQNPNLQNIPVRTDVGRQLRKAFKAPPGHALICADYSQIELRILAHCSEDPSLLEAFRTGRDIHAAVAAEVYGVETGAVSREQRANAKTINFGIIYGVTPFGLSRRIEGLDVPAAAQLIADYRARFPGIEQFLRRCVQDALEQGYVCTLMGRRRAIPELRSTNRAQRALGERLAINSVIQGTAADLIKAAMVNIWRRIHRENLPLKLLLQIHDELVLETPEERAAEHARLVCEEMEQAMKLRVPLVAECGIGPDWLAAK